MKRILIIFVLIPILGWAQFQTINFNAEGFPLPVTRESRSADICRLLGLSAEYSFRLLKDKSADDIWEQHHDSYEQLYKGYPIEHAVIKLHYRNGNIYYINGNYINVISDDILSINNTERVAFEVAKSKSKAKEYVWDNQEVLNTIPQNSGSELLFPKPHGKLVIYNPSARKSNEAFLAYKFDIFSTSPMARSYIYVDAKSGKIVGEENRIAGVTGTADTRYSGQRNIETTLVGSSYVLKDASRGNGIETYDMQAGSSFGSAVNFTDADNDWTSAEYNNANKDNAALDAHWGAMMTYDFFETKYGFESYDGNGAVIKGYVHGDLNAIFGSGNNDNAFWNGSSMVYGDGAYIYDALTAIDVVAHEFGHGWCQFNSGLVYDPYEESAWLNEGLADIWGACVENWATTGKDTWRAGDDITIHTPYYQRNFEDPNSSSPPQPDTYMGDYATGISPHTYAGVLTHWFYLLSEGGSVVNDFNNPYAENNDPYVVDGIGIDKAADIIFLAGTYYMTPTTTFMEARFYTIEAAQDLYGFCSPEVQSVINAWAAVGAGYGYDDVGLAIKFMTTAITTPSTEWHYAREQLIGENTLASGTNVKYESSGEVLLKLYFNASYGSNFLARITDCNTQSLPVYYKTDDEEKTAEIKLGEKQDISEGSLLLNLYPNPMNQSFSLLVANEEFESAEASIYDGYGRVTKKFIIKPGVTEVQVTGMSSGIYHVHIPINNKVYTRRIIIN